MADRFPNLYWSADYKSGIEQLTSQSLRSLKQLHDLRKLVFGYMNYFHSNSEFLTKLAIDSYPLDSSFKHLDDVSHDESLASRKNSALYKRISSPFSNRTVSQTEAQLKNMKSITSSPSTPSSKTSSDGHRASTEMSEISDDEKPDIDMAYAYEQCIKGAAEESQLLMNLSAVIDRNILEPLTSFLKIQDPEVRSLLKELNNIFDDYENNYKQVEDLKIQYDDYLRLNEFAESDPKNLIGKKGESDEDDDETTHDDSTAFVEPLDTVKKLPSPSPDLTLESEFDFPLRIGTAHIEKPADFAKMVKKMISSIKTIRRKIPIPGYKNEIFSSNQLCDWLIRYRPFRIDPSRMNMEKFGQGLIDHKLIVGFGLFAKKFNSENMWFEWSDMATFVADYEVERGTGDSTSTSSTLSPLSQVTSPSQKLPKLVLDEHTRTRVNDMAQNTSKKFEGIFKSVRSSLLKNDYSTQLAETEAKYNESYLDLQELKHLLEIEIFNNSQTLEKFERTKIEVVHQSLSKLLEINYNFSLQSTTRLHKQASEFIKDINKPETYEKDLNNLLETYSTGIYFPSIVSPDNLTKKHYSTNQSNNNFQNIKFQFNLYKDISLQTRISQSKNEKNLLSLSSLPEVLFECINIVKSKSKSETDLFNDWITPIHHQKYWLLKEEIIAQINNFSPDQEIIESSNENLVHKCILSSVISLLEKKDHLDIISFVKNWLLEISDSLIPCMVYDSLINNYKSKPSLNDDSLDIGVRRSECIKILSLIPRSNQSSLIYILEHLSFISKLDTIPNYGMTDEFNEVKDDKHSDIPAVVSQLNSMDQIGGIPFVHLILRPSSIKNASGFKPPLNIYNIILSDLLNVEVRSELLKNLIISEKNYNFKKENEKNNLGIQKMLPQVSQQHHAPVTPKKGGENSLKPTALSKGLPKSPRPISGENFSLRPFRTGTTPRPTPSASPRHTPRNSFEQNVYTGTESKSKGTRVSSNGLRTRSGSSSILAPNIDVQFEE